MDILKVSRLFLPRRDQEKWACPDAQTGDRAYWSEIERGASAAVSAVHLYGNPLAGERTADEVKNIMYSLLEREELDRLGKCGVLTERTTRDGMRYGIILAIDLDRYTFARGELSSARPAQEFIPSQEIRRGEPLEFPNAVFIYRGKNTLFGELLDYDPEELYDVTLPCGGGRVRGFYLEGGLAYLCVRELACRSKPGFIAVQGEGELAAAKLHWESIKPQLTAAERKYHPAKFMLAEFVNLYDEGVTFHAVNRLMEDVEPDVLCDFLTRNIKCVREGNTLTVKERSPERAVRRVDELLATYMRQNGGKVRYLASRKMAQEQTGEDSVAVFMPALPKEKLFSAVRGGALLPQHTFSFAPEGQGRFRMEGREVSYD